jgi:hypothetical protein
VLFAKEVDKNRGHVTWSESALKLRTRDHFQVVFFPLLYLYIEEQVKYNESSKASMGRAYRLAESYSDIGRARADMIGGEKKTKGTIYSLSVHPDGTRLATGGVGECSSLSRHLLLLLFHLYVVYKTQADSTDRKIKIWSTVPILDPAAESVEANNKLLCTMSEHTG